jgi:uncharacterized membrane protein
MLGLVAYGLFNVRGLTRLRRLTLHREGFNFRPVVGAERVVRWSEVEEFRTFTVTSLGSGYVSYRLRSMASPRAQRAPRGLGFFLQPDDLIFTLESWRLSSR